MTDTENRGRSLERRRTLNILGPRATVAHAQALACRAWPPYLHYNDGDQGAWLRDDMAPPLPLSALPIEDAVVRLFDHRASVDPERGEPAPLTVCGDVANLPQEARDPGSMHGHPALVRRANAITVCLPAVVLALLDGGVPRDLAEGRPCAARRALAELHLLYHGDDDPAFTLRERVLMRTLVDPPDGEAPIELRDDWQWMVYVTQESGTPGPGRRLGAADGLPLRCFGDLDEARRYAILQTDWSREIAGLPRDDDFLAAISRLATHEPDGSEIGWQASTHLTVIAPRRSTPLSPTVPANEGEK
jgi:hypothetical protein